MHVLHSLSGGGMERMLLRVLQRLPASAARHGVVTLREPGPLAARLPDHVALHALAPSSGGRDRFAALRLAAILRALRPSVVHARNWNAWTDADLAVRLAGNVKPLLVLGFHGTEHPDGFTTRRRRRARLLNLRRHRFTSVSRCGAELLHRQLAVPPDRVTLLCNGVDVEAIRPATHTQRAQARSALKLRPHEFVMVTIGTLIPAKGHELLIEALAQLSGPATSVRWLVLGDGPLREDLQRQAAQRFPTGTVDFVGEREDVRPFLQAADLFVHPSHDEQQSNAVLEAMAAGLPILATNVGDTPHLLNDGREAVLVAPRHGHAMTAALNTLANDDALRLRLGHAARRAAVENWSLDAAIERYQRFYESLLNPPTNAPGPAAHQRFSVQLPA